MKATKQYGKNKKQVTMKNERALSIVHVSVGSQRKKKFRQYCFDKDTDMTTVICQLIDRLLEEDNSREKMGEGN